MGKVSILTPRQKKVLSLVTDSANLINRFYFTGGTALSEYYLHHRYSEDIDLFSEQPIEPDTLRDIVSEWATKLKATVTPRLVDERMYICDFVFADDEHLKVDLCYYPYPRIEKNAPDGKLMIDSLMDIAVNKMITINQRATIKDFVDLYYLYPKFGYWDLSYGVEKKFKIKLDKFFVSTDMLIVDTFTTLPRMIKPLTIPKLKAFYRKTAIELAKDSVEK